MNLRLTDDDTRALRERAAIEGRSMQEVALDAIRVYTTARSDRERIDAILDDALPKHQALLDRLAAS